MKTFNLFKISLKSMFLAVIFFVVMLMLAVVFNVIFTSKDSTPAKSNTTQAVDTSPYVIQTPSQNEFVLNNVRIKFKIPNDWTGDIKELTDEGPGVEKITFRNNNNNLISIRLVPAAKAVNKSRQTGGGISYANSTLKYIGLLDNVPIYRTTNLQAIFDVQGIQNGYTFDIYGSNDDKQATKPFQVSGYLAYMQYFVQEPDIKLANAESILEKMDAVLNKITFQ